MALVAKKRSRVTGIPQVIAVVTFHVHWISAQVAAFDESSHTSGHVAELIVMPDCQLEPLFVGQCNKSLGLLLMECEWLLHIDVASAFQANPRDIVMAFRRRRDMDNVRSSITQEFS